MDKQLDVLLIPQSTVTSLSLSNPMRLTDNNQVVTVQKARQLCFPDQSPAETDASSWESCPTLNEAVLESMLLAAGFRCESIRDTAAEQDALHAALLRNPAVVCISTTFICSKSHLEKLIAKIRGINSTAVIVVGGPLVTLSYNIFRMVDIDPDIMKRIVSTYLFADDTVFADAYVYDPVYRGEEKLLQITQAILDGMPLEDIDGVICRRGGVFFFNVTDVVPAYRTPPQIDWRLLPQAYFSTGVIPLQASVGCPYACNFCNFPKNARTAGVKSDEDIVDELVHIHGRGARFAWFVDDNFRLGMKDLDRFLAGLVQRNPGVQWMSLMRADLLMNTDLNLLRESGCREVCLGLESADNQILKNMNKKASAEMYADVVARLLDSGINCSVYFIIGFPGETVDSVDRTLTFLQAMEQRQTKAHLFWSIFPFMLMPGSPVFSPAFRGRFALEGALSRWKHATMDSETAHNHTLRLFGELKESGPVYRGDDLDLLDRLGFDRCREFYTIRQFLARKALHGDHPDRQEIADSFKHLFSK